MAKACDIFLLLILIMLLFYSIVRNVFLFQRGIILQNLLNLYFSDFNEILEQPEILIAGQEGS